MTDKTSSPIVNEKARELMRQVLDTQIDELLTIGFGLLLDIQRAQQQLWHDWARMTADERVLLLKDLFLGLHEETAELQRRADRGRYHILKMPPPPTKERLAEDVIDIIKYTIAISALLGIDASQLAAAWKSKTKQVAESWGQERHDLARTTRLITVDIDGVCANWLDGFLAYLRKHDIKAAEHLVNLVDMDEHKDVFHATGGFKLLMPLPDAAETLRWVRAQGVKVAMVTARPHRRFPNIYRDTVDWLAENGFEYDLLLFEREKDVVLSRLSPAKIICHIEDRARHAAEMAAVGIRVLKMPMVEDPEVKHPLVENVTTWVEIKERLAKLLEV